MKSIDAPLKCYISAVKSPQLDAYLDSQGFGRGLIIFSVPDYGVLFRCRADGALIDLEFGAFFALLEFLATDLASEKIRSVQVISSNPEFVFAFTGNSRHLKENGERKKLLAECNRKYQLSIGYIEPSTNKSLWPPTEYASLMQGSTVKLEKSDKDFSNSSFEPFRRGARF